MKLDRITFMQTFPTGVYQNQKLSIEATLGDGENPIEAFREARKIVENAFVAMNPQIVFDENTQHNETEAPAMVEKSNKDERVQSFIATINMCTSKKFLENFKTRVDEEKNQELTEAYSRKLKEFG
jgi:hypothetical protein